MALNKVVLLRAGDFASLVFSDQRKAAVAIKPGSICVIGSTGTLDVPAANALWNGVVAIERGEVGKSIEDDYAIGDTVKTVNRQSGSEINFILAVSQTIAQGARISSAGGGQVHVSGGNPFGTALEAVTTGPSGTLRLAVLID